MLMQTGALAPIVERTYKDTTAFQWVREAYVNAAQAGATKVLFTTEWEAVKALDVHRRVIVDNGSGIPRDKVLGFLNKFGGSGRAIGATDGNYGIGVKVTTLSWNRHGVVALTRHGTEVTLVWLWYDVAHEDYGAREFNIGSEDDVQMSAVVPLDEFTDFMPDNDVDWCKVAETFLPEASGNGFALVLCGMTGVEDTVKGDPNREESKKYDIAQYLNGRLWNVPEGVEIKVTQYENWDDRTTWPMRMPETRQTRRPTGLAETIAKAGKPTKGYPDRGILHTGTLDVPVTADLLGAHIDWTLFTVPITVDRHYMVAPPITGVVHTAHDDVHEVFHLAAMGLAKREADAAIHKFVKVDAVAQRMAVIIRPISHPGMKIWPDAGRTRLRWESPTGSEDLPWDYWHQFWANHMPTEIHTAITEHYKAMSDGAIDLSEDDYRRLGEVYGSALKRRIARLVPARGGVPTPMDGTLGQGQRGGGTRPPRKPGGTRKTPAQRAPVSNASTSGVVPAKERVGDVALPKVITDTDLTEADWAVKDAGTLDGVRTIQVNPYSLSYRRCQDFIYERCEAKGMAKARPGMSVDDVRAKIYEQVDQAIRTHVTLAVAEILIDAPRVEKDDHDAMTSDAALSNTLKGIKAVENIASGLIGSALQGKRKSVAA